MDKFWDEVAKVCKNDNKECEILLNRKIEGYSNTYTDIKSNLGEIIKLPSKQKIEWLRSFELHGVGSYAALRAAQGDEFAKNLIDKKKEDLE